MQEFPLNCAPFGVRVRRLGAGTVVVRLEVGALSPLGTLICKKLMDFQGNDSAYMISINNMQ